MKIYVMLLSVYCSFVQTMYDSDKPGVIMSLRLADDGKFNVQSEAFEYQLRAADCLQQSAQSILLNNSDILISWKIDHIHLPEKIDTFELTDKQRKAFKCLIAGERVLVAAQAKYDKQLKSLDPVLAEAVRKARNLSLFRESQDHLVKYKKRTRDIIEKWASGKRAIPGYFPYVPLGREMKLDLLKVGPGTSACAGCILCTAGSCMGASIPLSMCCGVMAMGPAIACLFLGSDYVCTRLDEYKKQQLTAKLDLELINRQPIATMMLRDDEAYEKLRNFGK